MVSREEVENPPRYTVSQDSSGAWKVHPEGRPRSAVNRGTHAFACALARAMNGEGPEPGDAEALEARGLGGFL